MTNDRTDRDIPRVGFDLHTGDALGDQDDTHTDAHSDTESMQEQP